MSEPTDSKSNQKRAIDEVNGHVSDINSKKILTGSENSAKVKQEQAASENQILQISNAYEHMLDLIGENTSRDGLVKTPTRAAKAFLHFTKGYNEVLKGNLAILVNKTSISNLILV
jgi:GTP cyclohydrolase I